MGMLMYCVKLRPDAALIELIGENGVRLMSARIGSVTDMQLSSRDQENLRWYLEDYLAYPQEPAPQVAAQIERRMAQLGESLFDRLFQASDDARDLWRRVRDRIGDTRFEVIISSQSLEPIPWELIREPGERRPIVTRAQSFVRRVNCETDTASETAEPGPIRILLVICRPAAEVDVPFRSVATHLVRDTALARSEIMQLDVLRPPTFAQLKFVLQTAKAEARPYHIVHFDGHGTYEDLTGTGKPRGYLVFENPKSAGNQEYVHGELLGRALADGAVALLLLNACRSAHSEARTEPDKAAVDTKSEAFGSLAEEAAEAGVRGVLAMRYNVYVATATRFIATLYDRLIEGNTLGESVAKGRADLHIQASREVGFVTRRLQDWCVPIVYEATPQRLFRKMTAAQRLLHAYPMPVEPTTVQNQESATATLPGPPESGFIGRDETLLALDRAFDRFPVVLLHGLAGSGKTATASEFARWYHVTGGVGAGKVLFTSFEHHRPLARVLDELAERFQSDLEASNIDWFALNETERRAEVLTRLSKTPVLWIWDNVEPLTGFPDGAPSAWSASGQRELSEFLLECRNTKAKILLTSRRAETKWLADLPRRISMPPMRMIERFQLSRALFENRGSLMTQWGGWWSLLRFSQGNPLTIHVVVSQVVRDNLNSEEDIEAFVAGLRDGRWNLDDDVLQGRSLSLRAALSYGFESNLEDRQLRRVSLLRLFRDTVDADVLTCMGADDCPYYVKALRSITKDETVAMLSKLADIGWLWEDYPGYFTIHPAVPWYLRPVYDRLFACSDALVGTGAPEIDKAFVWANCKLASGYHNTHNAGIARSETRRIVAVEESNFLHALELALAHDLWSDVSGIFQGLDLLYYPERLQNLSHTLNRCLPSFVEDGSDAPREGREVDWSIFTEARVRLAEKEHQWEEAERLAELRVAVNERLAKKALQAQSRALDEDDSYNLSSYSSALFELAEIQRHFEREAAIDLYKQCFDLAMRLEDDSQAAVVAFNLGSAYYEIPRNLDTAEVWYHRANDLQPGNTELKSGVLSQLGLIQHRRLAEAVQAEGSERDWESLFAKCESYYLQSISLLPPDATLSLARSHQQLGWIYYTVGLYASAQQHLREALKHFEDLGDTSGAGRCRRFVGSVFRDSGDRATALEYFRAAKVDFLTTGDADLVELATVEADIRLLET